MVDDEIKFKSGFFSAFSLIFLSRFGIMTGNIQIALISHLAGIYLALNSK